MSRILVVHFDPLEAPPLCDRITREGFEASPYPHRGPAGFRAISADPPAAIVIDLMRTPSYGRTMGALLRERKSTRAIPLVFIKGDPAKTAQTRDALPDAVFTDLLHIGAALRRAIDRPPAAPVVPHGKTPLPQKLKIREGSVVALLYAPQGFEKTLAPLPAGVRLQKSIGKADVVLVFVKSEAALGRELPELARHVEKGRTIWLVWPKKAGQFGGRLTMPGIREMCVNVGLIDYKICAVDEVWSAIAIARRQ